MREIGVWTIRRTFNRHAPSNFDAACWGCPKVARPNENSSAVEKPNLADSDVGTQLPSRRISGYGVGLIRQPDSNDHRSRADNGGKPRDPCPPRAVGGRVCGFPLGAQIGATAILALAAWGFIFVGALRPFRLLASSLSDIAKAIGYGLLGVGLLVGAFCVGMIGS